MLMTSPYGGNPFTIAFRSIPFGYRWVSRLKTSEIKAGENTVINYNPKYQKMSPCFSHITQGLRALGYAIIIPSERSYFGSGEKK